MNYCTEAKCGRRFYVPCGCATTSTNTGLHLALWAAGTLLTVGCTNTIDLESSATPKTVPAASAFVMPPVGGPAIVGVIERRGSDQADQEILLATHSRVPGQNRFSVFVAEHANGQIEAPSRIRSDLRAALPSVSMKVSPYYVQNRYGPFGYAVGQASGSDLCLYGWQKIGGKASIIADQGLIDVRLRLCETGATEQQLLAVMYGYTITTFIARAGWNPYGSPPPPAASLGTSGADVYPQSATGFETVLAPRPKEVPRRRVRKVETVPEPVIPLEPKPDGPAVPPPPGETLPEPPPPEAQPVIPPPPSAGSDEPPSR